MFLATGLSSCTSCEYVHICISSSSADFLFIFLISSASDSKWLYSFQMISCVESISNESIYESYRINVPLFDGLCTCLDAWNWRRTLDLLAASCIFDSGERGTEVLGGGLCSELTKSCCDSFLAILRLHMDPSCSCEDTACITFFGSSEDSWYTCFQRAGSRSAGYVRYARVAKDLSLESDSLYIYFFFCECVCV